MATPNFAKQEVSMDVSLISYEEIKELRSNEEVRQYREEIDNDFNASK